MKTLEESYESSVIRDAEKKFLEGNMDTLPKVVAICNFLCAHLYIGLSYEQAKQYAKEGIKYGYAYNGDVPVDFPETDEFENALEAFVKMF